MLLKVFGHAFGNEMDGKAAGVGRDDGAGFAELRDTGEEFALDLEIFSDDFDDPIGFGDAGKIIFEIADRNFLGESGSKKSGGTGFSCGFKADADDFVSVGWGGVRLEIGRNDVEEDAREAGVGKVRGDARAHGACSENDCFLDGTSHGRPFWSDLYERTGYKNRHRGVKLGAARKWVSLIFDLLCHEQKIKLAPS